jgi:hypothetical protein
MMHSFLAVTVDMMKTATEGCDSNASGRQVHIWSRPQDVWNSGGVHPFTGGSSRSRIQEQPYVNKDSTPITIFLLFLMEVIELLVAGIGKVTEHHTMKAYWRSGGIALLILDLDTKWR